MVIPGIKWYLSVGTVFCVLSQTLGFDLNTKETGDTNQLENNDQGNLFQNTNIANEDSYSDLSTEEKLAFRAALQDYAREHYKTINSWGDDLPSQQQQQLLPEEIKRLSPSGFYGARGKKYIPQPNAFYGSRGKKSNNQPMMSGFYGSRGRKRRSSNNDLFYGNGKRIDSDTFFGMRGKRTQEQYYPALAPQKLYYHSNNNPANQVNYGDSGDNRDSYYDNNNILGNDLDESLLSYFPADSSSLSARLHSDEDDELSVEKERLKELMQYYISLRNQRMLSVEPYKMSNQKAKRQPPTGFHPIRGR